GGERVELLLHAEHVERRHTEDLRLATLEERRAVNAREDLDLGRERADVPQATAVDPEAVREDALADELLLQRAERRRELLLTTLEVARELHDDLRLDLVEAVLAVLLVRDR